uniref:LytTR family DNA-binding domain-containing protein n=1 Tax=Roseihalotalea indica TaxID=2867963 RepID=A0AA49GIP0_9BACT|nr:LytTR family DNA-binding domain-containing protein [Tunicatimonas sp. TK19036]
MLHIVAIDDNAAALSTIDKYTTKIPWVKLVATFTSPLEALDFLSENPVDIALIDVQMQDISGLDFISILKQKHTTTPAFIIISAYDQYAIHGYDLNISDYLLKPFGFDRFLTALEKARTRRKSETASPPSNSGVFVRQNSKYLQINPTTILWVESSGHTVQIYAPHDTPLLVTETMVHMENLLQPYGFHRVHKRYLVNRAYIQEMIPPSIKMAHRTQPIPIGKTYRSVIRHLGNNAL